MSSESTSLGTPQCLLTPSSKVKFQHHESIIAYNNVVALLEHHEPLFKPMLSFLLNCSICTSLTTEPSTMYVKYLKDFWYTAEVDDATKDISFSLSFFKNQLSFTRFDFLTAIGLTYSKSAIPLPPKGTVRAGLATLGLADKDKPSFTSTELVNSSPLKLKYFLLIWKIFMQYIVKFLGGMQGSHDQMNLSQQTIAYYLIFGLEINIRDIIFKDLINKLQNGKKNRETNTPSASEVSLTSHMLKVAKLSKKPEEYLILPSEEVNVEESADKSQSGTNVQPLSQPKAPTAKKSKKNKIPSLTQPKVSNDSREVNPPPTTTHPQATKDLVVTAVPIQSLEASVTTGVQNNQLKSADATEITKVKETRSADNLNATSDGDVTLPNVFIAYAPSPPREPPLQEIHPKAETLGFPGKWLVKSQALASFTDTPSTQCFDLNGIPELMTERRNLAPLPTDGGISTQWEFLISLSKESQSLSSHKTVHLVKMLQRCCLTLREDTPKAEEASELATSDDIQVKDIIKEKS
ncbi:hypothetical protein Tco_0752579 [Tanacetum coccineum]|uniref:Uncharacterized protein n=1 Tax=Tanacetum coccineum TaxID=301880 RepID=A0ABQ4Z784_9ASTR